MVLLASSIFFYTRTAEFGTKMVGFTAHNNYFPAIPRWLLLVISSVTYLATWLCLLPALASFVKRTRGESEKSRRLLAKSASQNAVLVATLCVLGTIIFGAPRSSVLYGIFFFLYAISVAALPALYSLAAFYFVALGRGSELGALFGAVSIWVAWGDLMSVSELVLRVDEMVKRVH
ncbi:hypothetical protein DFH06DRAFT_453321 [Mycena polygramma]|nr:hypothetical protein DFH06DRAFT_453321 [Mycena polygramma]